MIDDWRSVFDLNLNFQIIQIANYGAPAAIAPNSGWARIREAQRSVATEDDNAELIVTIDLGDSENVHPENKADVGKRTAMSALTYVYDHPEKLSPAYKTHDTAETAVIIRYVHVSGKLRTANEGDVKGFAWCPENGKCRPAKASIAEDDTVIVNLPDGKMSGELRYGWANNPIVNLYDESGMPAEPFSIRLP